MTTQEQVNDVCKAIEAEGKRPTVDKVRAIIKISSNTLTPMVRAWKENQGQRERIEVPPAAGPIEPSALPTAIQRAVDVLTAAVTNLGPAFSLAITEIGETERRRSRLEVEAASAGARAQVEEARLTAEDERAATDAVRNELLELETIIGAKDEEVKQLTASLLERERALTECGAEVEQLTGRVELEHTGRAEAKARVAELTNQIQAAWGENAAAKAAAEAAEADAQRQRDQVAAIAVRLDAAQATIAELRTDSAVARERADGEQRRAERAEADVDRLRRERAEAEVVTREAIATAAKVEGEIEGLQADLVAKRYQSRTESTGAASPRPRRSGPTREVAPTSSP